MIIARHIDCSKYEPCKDLLASIIERAILDLRQPAKHIRDAARVWLFSDSLDDFSLLWCLHWLDMEGAEITIRAKAQKIIRAAGFDLLSVRYMHGSVLELDGVRRCAL